MLQRICINQFLQPVGAVSMICIWFIVPSTGLPELTPERIQLGEAKFKRYTRGKWNPRPGSLAFRLGLLDYVGSVLLLGRAYDLKRTFYIQGCGLTMPNSYYLLVTRYSVGRG